jgi:murein DD-endopeptidase MepM/ murein hydrolase activator NlpD
VLRARLLLVLAVGTTALTSYSGPTGPAVAAPGPTSSVSVLWGWPLAGRPLVTRGFDPPSTRFGAGHRGVDLAAVPGQQVVAAGAGVVVFAGLVAGRPVVSVDHAGGLRTTYEPVQPVVAAGQVVARGSPLGGVVAGHGGCPADACLHWGLRRGDAYLDPLALLRPPRVRLLPWH